MDPHTSIIEAVARLAIGVPPDVVERVAQVVSTSEMTAVRSRVAEAVPHPGHRNPCLRFVGEWLSSSSPISTLEAAISLRTAVHLGRLGDRRQTIELAWTGPRSQSVPHRHTEQAILQVLDSASRRITIVSYAVYRIPHVRDALVRAARRGVRVKIIETPDKIQGQREYDTIRALGEDVATCSTLYFWPKDRRKKDSNGKIGILHVKCVVADGRWLFLSSANLTEYAFSINMELGALITGGEQPMIVERLFQQLIEDGLLEAVKADG